MKIAFVVPILVMMCGIARADVASVRREVARINAQKLSVKTHDSTDFSLEGARISVRRDGKGVARKIDAQIYGEGGRTHETMYLQNGKPLFVFSVEERYYQPVGTSSRVQVVSRTETRFYFERGQLIQKRVGKKVVTLARPQKIEVEFLTAQRMSDYLGPHEGRRSTY